MINLFKFLQRKKPCYRCAGNGTVTYMGLDYCVICLEVIMRMLPVVGMGGMFGFPGASGYLQFPKLEATKKKEN